MVEDVEIKEIRYIFSKLENQKQLFFSSFFSRMIDIRDKTNMNIEKFAKLVFVLNVKWLSFQIIKNIQLLKIYETLFNKIWNDYKLFFSNDDYLYSNYLILTTH